MNWRTADGRSDRRAAHEAAGREASCGQRRSGPRVTEAPGAMVHRAPTLGDRLLLGLLLALALMLARGAEAQASIGHRFLSSISQGAEGMLLEEPTSVAVDHATGQVFVGDERAETVDVYSAAGSFETTLGEEVEAAGIAIDEENGDVYVAEPFSKSVIAYRLDGGGSYQLLAEWSGAATPGKGFGEVTGVAFDNAKPGADPAAGDLYVVEAEALSEGQGTGVGAVDVFKPKPNPTGSEEGEGEEGGLLKRLEGVKLEEPNGVAVDSNTGQVLVADSVSGFIASVQRQRGLRRKAERQGPAIWILQRQGRRRRKRRGGLGGRRQRQHLRRRSGTQRGQRVQRCR